MPFIAIARCAVSPWPDSSPCACIAGCVDVLCRGRVLSFLLGPLASLSSSTLPCPLNISSYPLVSFHRLTDTPVVDSSLFVILRALVVTFGRLERMALAVRFLLPLVSGCAVPLPSLSIASCQVRLCCFPELSYLGCWSRCPRFPSDPTSAFLA